MSSDPNPLIGYWVLAAAPESPHEVGSTHLHFTTAGLLQEGYENESRIHVLSFRYSIEGNAIATICPPNPRTELTPFSVATDRSLILEEGNSKTTWIQSERKEFFESKNIWDPGILFERQVDYMSILDMEPRDYQKEHAKLWGISPEVLVNTDAMWKCWKYGRSRFASFHLDDFDQILKRGVLIDDDDNENRTLLSYLAEDGNTPAVQMAVEYGADVNHDDLYRLTALDYATLGNRKETVGVLRKLGGIHGSGFSEIQEVGKK